MKAWWTWVRVRPKASERNLGTFYSTVLDGKASGYLTGDSQDLWLFALASYYPQTQDPTTHSTITTFSVTLMMWRGCMWNFWVELIHMTYYWEVSGSIITSIFSGRVAQATDGLPIAEHTFHISALICGTARIAALVQWRILDTLSSSWLLRPLGCRWVQKSCCLSTAASQGIPRVPNTTVAASSATCPGHQLGGSSRKANAWCLRACSFFPDYPLHNLSLFLTRYIIIMWIFVFLQDFSSFRVRDCAFLSLFELCLVCTMWSVRKGKDKRKKKSFGDIWYWSLLPIWAKEGWEKWESSDPPCKSSGFLFCNLPVLPRIHRRRFCALTFGSAVNFHCGGINCPSLRGSEKIPEVEVVWRAHKGIFRSGGQSYFVCSVKVQEFRGHSWSWEETERCLSYVCLPFFTEETAAGIPTEQVVFREP